MCERHPSQGADMHIGRGIRMNVWMYVLHAQSSLDSPPGNKTCRPPFHSSIPEFLILKSKRFHLLVSFCGRLWFPLIKSTITLFWRVKMWQQNVSLMLSHRKMFGIGVSPCFWEIRNCRSYVVVVICEQYVSKLTPWNLGLLVKPPVVQLFKTFWKLYGTRMLLLRSPEPSTSPYLEAVEPSPFYPKLSAPRSSLILSTHPYLGLTSDFPAFLLISYILILGFCILLRVLYQGYQEKPPFTTTVQGVYCILYLDRFIYSRCRSIASS
jgi:hypothetical protein